MKPVALPIAVDDWPLGSLRLSLEELRSRYGDGIPGQPILFGDASAIIQWPMQLEDGQLVLLVLHGTDEVQVFAEPKDLDRALRGLGIGQERVTFRVEPRPQRSQGRKA